jgi:hypothetical protein
MEPESSLPYSQVPATCPYPEPAPSSPHNPLPLMYKTLTAIMAKRIFTHLEEQSLLPANKKDVTLEVKATRIK